MSAITRINAYVATDESTPAGAAPTLYLSLAGREFLLHSTAEGAALDLGAEFTYVLGEEGNTTFPDANDPRSPQLSTENLDKNPAYLRCLPHPVFGDWVLDRITVTVNPGVDDIVYDNLDLAGPDTYIHMSNASGDLVFLTRV